MSRSLEPSINAAQALSEACGHVIGDHLGDRHIHHPRRRARYATGMTHTVDHRGPDPPIAVVRLRWADHVRRVCVVSCRDCVGGATHELMNGALDSAGSLARAVPYRVALRPDPRPGGRDVIGDRPQRGAGGPTSDVCARSETPRQGALCVFVGHPDVANARRRRSRSLHPNRAMRRDGSGSPTTGPGGRGLRAIEPELMLPRLHAETLRRGRPDGCSVRWRGLVDSSERDGWLRPDRYPVVFGRAARAGYLPAGARPLDPPRPYFDHHGHTLRFAAICRDAAPCP